MEEMKMRYMAWLITALAVVSCAGQVADESSPYSRMPVGSTVVLQQDLAVPAGHARVFLQHGKVVEKRRLDVYYPHCNFEQHAVSDGTAVIKADRFRVTAVGMGEDYVVQRDALIHAGWSMAGEFGGVSMINRYVGHTLNSPSQPQVTRLTCHGGFAFPGEAVTPSLTDIRTALGVVATVELP
jgi:hypothetical protein